MKFGKKKYIIENKHCRHHLKQILSCEIWAEFLSTCFSSTETPAVACVQKETVMETQLQEMLTLLESKMLRSCTDTMCMEYMQGSHSQKNLGKSIFAGLKKSMIIIRLPTNKPLPLTPSVTPCPRCSLSARMLSLINNWAPEEMFFELCLWNQVANLTNAVK